MALVLQRQHYRKASSLQIDHTVPVENAWISGAWQWTQATRVRYYNDLGDPRTLVAVDSHDNESKGDHDPTTWLPSHGEVPVRPLLGGGQDPVASERHPAEKGALVMAAGGCPNTTLKIRPGPVKLHP